MDALQPHHPRRRVLLAAGALLLGASLEPAMIPLTAPGAQAAPSTFHCRRCGRAIFTSDQILDRRPLWDLGEYQAPVFVIAQALDLGGMRRSDASLHEGWYCCRFMVMRMVVDKFGTGDALLVYADSVVELPPGGAPPVDTSTPAQVRLSEVDFDAVLAARADRDRLAVVKLGAIWCPPCRMMDRAIEALRAEGALPDVDFYEVDVDESPALAARYRNRSIPFFLFFYRGEAVRLVGGGPAVVDGGLAGGLSRASLRALCAAALTAARAGQRQLQIGA